MKTLILCLLIPFVNKLTYAQKSTMRLFDKLPQTITVDNSELSKIFDYAAQKHVSIKLNKDFTFTGEVVSNIDTYPYMKTVVIKSFNYNAAFMRFVRVTWEEKITYTGTIYSKDFADGFSLGRIEKEQYILSKFDPNTIIQDCFKTVTK
jgi:hypothetical protein